MSNYVQGVEINLKDKVSFMTKHNYDKVVKVGYVVGFLHFDVAKTMFDIVAYYKNLAHQNIISDTPFTEMEYLVIKDENSKYFASPEQWMVEGSFKKISENYRDFRIYNIETDVQSAKVLLELKNLGYPSKQL